MLREWLFKRSGRILELQVEGTPQIVKDNWEWSLKLGRWLSLRLSFYNPNNDAKHLHEVRVYSAEDAMRISDEGKVALVMAKGYLVATVAPGVSNLLKIMRVSRDEWLASMQKIIDKKVRGEP